MQYMFSNAEAFNQPIGSWNTAGVRDMKYMFSNAVAFNQSIGSWSTSRFTDTQHMFSGATSSLYFRAEIVNGAPTLVLPPCPAGNFQAPSGLGCMACQTGRWAPEGSLQCHDCPQNSIPADDQSRCEDFEDCPALQFAFDGAECVWWHLPLSMLAIIAFLVSRHLFHLLGFCLHPLGWFRSTLTPLASLWIGLRHISPLSSTIMLFRC